MCHESIHNSLKMFINAKIRKKCANKRNKTLKQHESLTLQSRNGESENLQNTKIC